MKLTKCDKCEILSKKQNEKDWFGFHFVKGWIDLCPACKKLLMEFFGITLDEEPPPPPPDRIFKKGGA